MTSFRRAPVLTLGTPLALLVTGLLLFEARGSSQAPVQGRLVRSSTLPGIDRGVMAGDGRAPDGVQVAALRTLSSEGRVVDRVAADRSRYLSDRVIVKFRGTMTAAGRARAVSETSRSATLAGRPGQVDFDEVRIDPGDDPEAVARAFRARADVEYAQPAYRVRGRLVPNDTFYAQLQWNFPQVDLERGWEIQNGASSSIIVAVLDTGMAYRDAVVQFRGFAFSVNGASYPALGLVNIPFARATDLAAAGAGGDGRFVLPKDFIWNDNDPLDLDGHGTHVAGTIGQLTNNASGVAGIAFNARLMPLKVVSTDWDDIFASPNAGSDETVAQGIRYAADNGAKILNMSIGRTGTARSAPAVEEAMRYAVGKGCFIAVAGGNGFQDGNELEVYGEIASRLDGVVSVAAVDRARSRASYSTTGSWIELAAPGGLFTGFGNTGLVYQQSYDFTLTDTYLSPPASFRAPRFDGLAIVGLQGTSMATPHVSGVAALLMQQGYTKPAAIEAALKKFATDLGTAGRDNEFGYGEINARATLRGLGLSR